MLHISMKIGEYLTIGDDTVVQFDDLVGERARMTINAPREVPILRGEVWERSGMPTPACVAARTPRKKHKCRTYAIYRWNDDRERAVRKMEKLAEQLEENGAADAANTLRTQLDHLVPAVWEDEVK